MVVGSDTSKVSVDELHRSDSTSSKSGRELLCGSGEEMDAVDGDGVVLGGSLGRVSDVGSVVAGD